MKGPGGGVGQTCHVDRLVRNSLRYLQGGGEEAPLVMRDPGRRRGPVILVGRRPEIRGGDPREEERGHRL